MTLNNSNVKREKNEKNACKEDGFTRVSYNVRYDWFGRKKKTEQVTNVRTTCVSTTIRIMRIDLQSSIETVPAFADHCSESNACWWPVVVTLSRFCSEQKYETRANNTRDRVLFRLLTDECARRHNNYFVARVTFRLQTATSRSGIRLGAVSLLPVARWSYIIYKHYYRIRTRGGGGKRDLYNTIVPFLQNGSSSFFSSPRVVDSTTAVFTSPLAGEHRFTRRREFVAHRPAVVL